MIFDDLGVSLIFWDVVSFLVLLSLLWMGFAVLHRRVGRETGAAREDLDRRHADGEMTREEYLTIREDTTRYPHA